MSVSKSLDRAWRRLRPARQIPSLPPQVEDAVGDAAGDVVVSLVRPELERLLAALTASLDPHMPRPDSPALLAGALGTAIGRFGGIGRPSVTRSPAGLYSPEFWHIRVDGADAPARQAVNRLLAGERIS